MPDISVFTNSKYKVLSYLYENKDENNLIKITQNEIGEALEMNRTTVNYVIKVLKEHCCIIHDDSKVGRYYLTDVGIKTVELLREVNKL